MRRAFVFAALLLAACDVEDPAAPNCEPIDLRVVTTREHPAFAPPGSSVVLCRDVEVLDGFEVSHVHVESIVDTQDALVTRVALAEVDAVAFPEFAPCDAPTDAFFVTAKQLDNRDVDGPGLRRFVRVALAASNAGPDEHPIGLIVELSGCAL